MSKTNALRKIIQQNISKVTKSYHRKGNAKHKYPYAVYSLDDTDLGDLARDDYILIIDLWDQGEDTSQIEEMADQIEAMFNAANMPGDEVLPTFYRIGRKPIDDEDKTLIHRQLKFQVQNYSIGG